MVSLSCALAFLLVAFTQSLTSDLDLDLLVLVSEWRTPCFTLTMHAVSWLGSGAAEAPFAVGVVGVLLRRGRRLPAAGYTVGTLVGWGVYGALKASFQRTRPSLVERLGEGGWYGFPSGHAMLAPIVYVVAVYLLWPKAAELRGPALALAWSLVVLIAFSRVYLGVHYPSDVVAGVLGGTAWLGLTLLALGARRPDLTAGTPGRA